MKRIWMILACLLVISLLFAACTPESKKADQKPIVPDINDPTGVSAQPGPDENFPESGEANQDTDASEPEAPAQSEEPGLEPPASPSAADTQSEPETEFSGLDIEDEYTETIAENIGVGGN